MIDQRDNIASGTSDINKKAFWDMLGGECRAGFPVARSDFRPARDGLLWREPVC